MYENPISELIVDAARTVHMRLGPGLLESVYDVVLGYELPKHGLQVARQVPITIRYDGLSFD